MPHQSNSIIKPLTIAILSVIAFMALAHYIFYSDLTQIQQTIFNFMSHLRNTQLNTLMLALTKTANPLPIIIVTLIISVLLFLKHHKREAFFSLLTIITTAGTNSILKHVFVRERPSFDSLIHETGFSFPSGHSMISFALALLLSYLSFYFLSKRWLAFLVSLLCFSYAILVGFSRVYISVHYAGDVLGGWLAATAVFSILLCFFNLIALPIKKDLSYRR